MRAIFSILLACWCATASVAQDLSGLARVYAQQSSIEDGWFGKTTLRLALSQGVPFRVFMLDNPARLVVDFREADWSGLTPADLLPEQGRVQAVRFGAFQPGWSRLVADLSEPMVPADVSMSVPENAGTAILEVVLEQADAEVLKSRAGAPIDPDWTTALTQAPKAAVADVFTVVLDPGHGGVDPGAEQEGVAEKDLMLNLARSLREELLRKGVNVVMTRDGDHFVALEQRVAIAHQAQGDVFISLHADILTLGGAKGATVYTLSQEASDTATAHLAARHNRSDIIAGADLTGSDDQVASVLLDLARQETEPRSRALAEALAEGMAIAGGPMNRRPLRKAGFSVLKSADIPSVLVEVGFLSSKRDLANLRDPVWRAVMVDAIADAIMGWRDADAAIKPLVRQ